MKFILLSLILLITACENSADVFGDAAADIYDFVKGQNNKATGSFWVIDTQKDLGDTGYFYLMDFTKRIELNKVVIYVETSRTHTIDSLTLLDLANEFENVIEPAVTGVYKSSSDVDNNNKTILLLYDIKDGFDGSGGFVGGYFFNGDLYDQEDINNASYPTNTVRSNEAEILYIDMVQQDPTSASVKSTIAHEFQHLVGFNQRFFVNGNASTEFLDTWISEGIAENMEYITYGQVSLDHRMFYLSSNFDPNTSLVVFNENDRLSSYALSAAYFNFMLNKMGNTNFLHTLNIQAEADYRGIGKILNSVYNQNNNVQNFIKSFYEFSIDGLYKVKTGIFPDIVKGTQNNVAGKFTGISNIGTSTFTDFGFSPRFLKYQINSSVTTSGSDIVIDLSKTTNSILPTTSISQIGQFDSNNYGIAFIANTSVSTKTITASSNGFISTKMKSKSKSQTPHKMYFNAPKIKLEH